MRVLLVEDDERLARVVRRVLEQERMGVNHIGDGPAAIAAAGGGEHDVIILDAMLPLMNGIQVTKVLRESGNHTPVLMLTALGEVHDRVAGLDSGADDYLTKPFAIDELLARLRALARRRHSTIIDTALQVGELSIDLLRHQASMKGVTLELTPTEFRLLEVLARQPHRVFSRMLLLEQVWGYDFDGNANVVETYIAVILLFGGSRNLPHVSRSLHNNQEVALLQSMHAVSLHTLEELFHQNVSWPYGSAASGGREEEVEEHDGSGSTPPVEIESGAALIVSSNGNVIYPPSLVGRNDLVEPITLTNAATDGTARGTIEIDDMHYATLVAAVVGERDIVGFVQVVESDEPLREALSTLQRSLLFVGLAGVGVAVVGGALLSTQGLRPLREAFARQRAFISDASHQLKTPVAIVRADAEALERSDAQLDPDDAQILRDLVESSVFLSGLVNQLLVVARMEGEQRPEAHENRRPARPCRRDRRQHAARRSSQRRVLVLRPRRQPILVSAVPLQFRLALLALIDNGIKYNVPGGTVTVTIERQCDWGRVTVADTGIGIPAADQRRVWERFYRAEGPRASSIDGAGLGLPIIREIVRQHRGRISLTSEEGKGTAVEISLRCVS